MPSATRPCARWKRLTALRVCGPRTPSAARPSARWTARTPSVVVVVAVAAWAAPSSGPVWPITPAAMSAAEIRAVAVRGMAMSLAAVAARRRCERARERSHSSGRPRSRTPGGSAKIANRSSVRIRASAASIESSLVVAAYEVS